MYNNFFLRRCWTETDLDVIKNNYLIYKSCLPRGMKAAAVVKADAYGHGDCAVADVLQREGADYFAVSNIKEAIHLRENGIVGEILILGYTPAECAEELYKYDITQALVSREHALSLSASKNRIKCQFAVDTGMNRIGLDGDNAAECESIIREYKDKLNINGIFTHLCVADGDTEEDIAFTKRQIALFKKVADSVADLDLPYVHCMNSAGGLFYADGQPLGNLARLGIVLYGLKPDIKNTLPDGIKPAMTWKTVVSMVKKVRPGETVGYGRTFTAHSEIDVATLPVGYADGYNRLLSNKGYVVIKGKKAPVIGRVCMDQITVDVSGIDGVKQGDEVILMGDGTDNALTADGMAQLTGTIGYEIVCDISKRVERVYK